MNTITEELKYIKRRNQLFNSLIRYSEEDGFIKVESDLFEDVFDFVKTNQRFNIQELIKLEDQRGQLYFLRPDITTNIIKQVIPKISEEDELKLYYLDKTYAYGDDGNMVGVRQFGVEMIGGNSYEKEVALLSFIEGLLDQYQLKYNIEIGNQLFVDVLIDELTKDQDTKSIIKNALMKKNVSLLDLQTLDNIAYKDLLMMLFNPTNDIESIKTFILNQGLNQKLIDEIDRTIAISNKMNQYNITIDLGLVSPYDYYNGPIFKGYIEGYYKDIFRGGRYDTLTRNYGTLTKALGFSLDISPLLKVVLSNEN